VVSDWVELVICSCAGLVFQASLEKSLNFRKLKKSLNCFGKEWKALKNLEFFYRESFKTCLLCKVTATVAVKLVEERLRPFY